MGTLGLRAATTRHICRAPAVLILFAFIAGILCRGLVAAADSPNFVRNGEFEQKDTDWSFVTVKAETVGKVVEEPAGNHCLMGVGPAYWLAETGEYFEGLGLEKYAGKKLTLSFSAKGDEDAYPGFLMVAQGKDKTVYPTLFWQTKWVVNNITLTRKFTRYERTFIVPADVTKVYMIRIYNCTSRGKLYIDNIRLAPAQEKVAAKPQGPHVDAAWVGLQFTDRELIELSNSCNLMITQWARTYGTLQDAARAAFYAGAYDRKDDPRAARIVAQEQSLMQLRDRLKALQQFYVGIFKPRFGEHCVGNGAYRFYHNNNDARRDLIFGVGETRSAKAPITALEGQFARAQQDAQSLLRELQGAAASPAAERAPAKKAEGPSALFDDQGRPTRILWGIRLDIAELVSYRWLDFDFFGALVIYPEYDAQDNMSMRELSHAPERKYWNISAMARPMMDPYVWWLPPSLRERCRTNPELFSHTEKGVMLPSKRGNREVVFRPNCFHDEMERELQKHYEQYTRALKAHPDVPCLYYAAEFTPYTTIGGEPYIFGYSQAAQRGFRERMKARFGAVEKLNAAWGAHYADFDAIQLPTRKMFKAMEAKDLPLIYEYRRFRKQRYSRAFQKVYEACRRGSNMSIMTSGARAYMNGNSLDANEALSLAQAVDVYCNHNCADGSYKDMAEQVYYESIADYLGHKPRGKIEYYPGYPEAQYFNWEEQDTMVLFRRMQSTFWKDLALGNQVLSIWPWPTHRDAAWMNHAPNFMSGYTLNCDYMGSVPLVRDRLAGGAERALMTTRIVPSAVGLLAPYDATMVCQPDGQIMVEAAYVHKFLDDRNYDYRCVPEELVLNGQESLQSFKVLIAPYTLWASRGLQEKLPAWVGKGGILICVAPLGLWDEYGRSSRVLVDAAFGDIPIEVGRGETYTFAYPYKDFANRKGVKIEATLPYQKEAVNLISAGYGRGRIYMTADPTIRNVASTSRAKLLQAIDREIGARTAWCQDAQFDLVTRYDGEQRHLFVLNRSISDPAEDLVIVRGEYPKPIDLGMPGGCPLKSDAKGGLTAFRLRLGPGEGTCIRLGAYREMKPEPGRIAALAGNKAEQQTSQIAACLAAVAPSGNLQSTVRALICTKAALAFLGQEDFAEALELAQQAQAIAAEAAPAGEPVYEAGHVAAPPKIDGDLADWGAEGWTPFGGSRFKAAWDADNLYFAIQVTDAQVLETRERRYAWSGDSVELYLDCLAAGGHRKLGLIDFQYVFAADGASEIYNRKLHALRESRFAAGRTANGFVIEAAIACSETQLVPVSGYNLALNLRQIDYSMEKGQRKLTGDTLLKKTGFTASQDTYGWPLLRLVGGPARALTPQARYNAAARCITVQGFGNTLAGIAQQVGADAVMRSQGGEALLAADLSLADGAQLILDDVIVAPMPGAQQVAVRTGRDCTIELRGNAVFRSVDAAALKGVRLWSLGRHTLAGDKTVRVKALTTKGVPVANVGVRVVVVDVSTGKTVLDKDDARLDKDGIVAFDLPAWIMEADGTRSAVREPRYDLLIDDKELNASYPVQGVAATGEGVFEVVFTAHRGIK